jgi:hypothetical protein
MNLTPRENCTVEGGHQLDKIAAWGGHSTLSNTLQPQQVTMTLTYIKVLNTFNY